MLAIKTMERKTYNPYRELGGLNPDQTRDILMSPLDWPQYPYLPLTRQNGSDTECGILWVNNITCQGLKVWKTNLFGMPVIEVARRRLDSYEYSSIDALLEDGWKVS